MDHKDAPQSPQTYNKDKRLLYYGTRAMQFNTLPAEFFGDPEKFVDSMKNDKREFLKKHLMVSQLLVCRKQDETDGIEDDELKRQRADRVMMAKGREFFPEHYYFAAISEETPKMYMLDFPPQMQAAGLCKRLYFLIGENGKIALYTVESAFDGSQTVGEIKNNLRHITHAETPNDSAFEETKQILELFIGDK